MNKKNKSTINPENPSASATGQDGCVQVTLIRSFQQRNHQVLTRKHLSIDSCIPEKLAIRGKIAMANSKQDSNAPRITTAT